MKQIILLILVATIAYFSYQLLQSPSLPEIKHENYWGAGKPKDDDITIKPFKINVPDKVLEDLNKRLDMEVRLQPTLEGINFQYGFKADELKKIVKHWRNDYKWRDREAKLNSLPQFTTQIFGLNVHFIHAKPQNVPKNVEIIPLLIVHGWPGTVKEFYEIIPMLTTVSKDRNYVFEVIAPSLPGYAFSEASHKPGLNPSQIAIMFRHLMLRLGFNKFYAQGGDWGSFITSNLALIYPENVLGVHSNMCAVMGPLPSFLLYLASFWPSAFMDKQMEEKIYPMSYFIHNMTLESGYLHIQATKPDTVGVALNNSPVGLAAYILEKFSTWTDFKNRDLPDGGLTKKYKLDDLLDNVMLFWVTGSITSSMRIYSECFTKKYHSEEKWDEIPINVPHFCAAFPNELAMQPNFILKLKYKNLVSDKIQEGDPMYETVRPPRGGHFAAFEEPKLTYNSIVHAIKLFKEYKK